MLVQPIDKLSERPAAIGSMAPRPTAFRIPGGLGAIIVDGSGSLGVQSDGKPVAPPLIKVALPLIDGGSRQLVILRAEGGSRVELVSRDTGTVMPVADFAPLDHAQLLSGLDAVGRLRLMRQLLDTCRDLFDLRHDVGYGRLCRTLAADLAGEPSAVKPQAIVSDRFALVSAALPASFGGIKDLFLVSERGIGTVQHQPQPFGRGEALFLLERALLRPGALLVALGEREIAVWKISELPELPFLSWLRANRKLAKPVRGFVVRALAAAPSRDESAEILLREMELLQPAAKRDLYDKATPIGAGIDLLVADGAGGVFLRGWLRDPHQLVARAELSCPGMAPQRLDEAWLRFPRPDIDKHYDGRPLTNGFAAFLPSAGTLRGQAKIELHLASGATLDVLARPAVGTPAQLRDAVLGAVPPESLTTEAIATCIAPPAARLHASYLAMRKNPDIVELGSAVADPIYSVIVPLYRNLDYLRFQIGAFAIDPILKQAEIIYVLDSPEQRAELVHFLSGLHQLYDLPMKILIMSGNFGYAAANNAAADIARGKFLLLLNSDVVPEGTGWLERLAAPLMADRKAVASGARLLFDDQSLQHAGMRFARDAGGHWLNLHYFKGAPRDFAPARATRKVPAVTGAALLVRAERFRAVGGFTEDYIIGDYEDSDLCLKLRAEGGEIYFCPEATLFHFERKSINRHAGYQRSVAGLYNRWLAGRRWDQSMSELMRRFDAAADGALS